MKLTPREHDVMALLIEGLPFKTIAARLGTSGRTVTTQLHNAYKKLGAKNGPHAAAIYVKEIAK